MRKVFCNRCGKELDEFDSFNNFHWDYHIGYGSLYDGDHFEIDLCCPCFDEVAAALALECQFSPFNVKEGVNRDV